MQARSVQLSSLRASSVKPAPLALHPSVLRNSVSAKAQKQEQPLVERAQLALMPLSLACAELLTHPVSSALAEEEEKQPGRLFDCES